MKLENRFWRAKFTRGRSAAPPGERIYAIGDVHGRIDLLDALLDRIDAEARQVSGLVVRLILLGDLINRGYDSRAVIERVIRARTQYDAFHWLTGNHEEMLRAALNGDDRALRRFLHSGGRACLLSYGLDPAQYRQASLEQLGAVLPRLIPEQHRSFLATGEDVVARGDYVFVHAGIRPGVSLDRQKPEDLRWIRDDFLNAHSFDGVTVVHGHTISRAPVNLPHRIGLDTGAFSSGMLSAVALEGDKRWMLTSTI